MAQCPVCDAQVELTSDAVVGELMECPDCGTELEVLETDPGELGEAPETEEDSPLARPSSPPCEKVE